MKPHTARKTRQPEGLIGLFGHAYVADEHVGRTIQYQFEIIRRMEGDRYVIQYFSFLDGSPTNVSVMTEAELLGPDVRLYATTELWNVYEKSQRECDRRRSAWART
jgi:hypothetical protein